jgi:hypothetical protein
MFFIFDTYTQVDGLLLGKTISFLLFYPQPELRRGLFCFLSFLSYDLGKLKQYGLLDEILDLLSVTTHARQQIKSLFSYFELCTTVRELESPEHMIFC